MNKVIFHLEKEIKDTKNVAYLFHDTWNDFHRFRTTYRLVYVDAQGIKVTLGRLKIGHRDMQSDVPVFAGHEFPSLGSDYFSLGFDENYYDNIKSLPEYVRKDILESLRDIAYSPALIDDELNNSEDVLVTSLLRFYTVSEVKGMLNRRAHAKPDLTAYSFEYLYPVDTVVQDPRDAVKLTFSVEPHGALSTNMHVIVGKNGVGKSQLLGAICKSVLSGGGAGDLLRGGVTFTDENIGGSEKFAGAVLVSFSAFDKTEPKEFYNLEASVRFEYVGLKKGGREACLSSGTCQSDMAGTSTLKTPENLGDEFSKAVIECRSGVRIKRWAAILELLEFEPYFSELKISRYGRVDAEFSCDAVKSEFAQLSSGHAIVLLTLARLTELIDERYLVLIDEPELHLHPPLLSVFISALSLLLVERNAVCILATHAPMVLQEIPATCCWVLRRDEGVTSVSRPRIETYGESSSAIAREIFGVDLENAGFYEKINQAVMEKRGDYSAVLGAFGGALGSEARSFARIACSDYE